MTKQARTKQCHCGNQIVEAANISNAQWENKKFCSKKCKTIEIKTPVARIIELYTKHQKSNVEIAAMFSVSHPAISRLLQRNGIKVSPKGSRIKAADKQPIIDLYRKLNSAEKVSHQFPYCRKSIDKFLQEELVMLPRHTQGIIKEAFSNPDTIALNNWR